MVSICSCYGQPIGVGSSKISLSTNNSSRTYVVKHADEDLKSIFREVALKGPFFMVLVRIPVRIVSLISGDFIRSGLWLAEQELEKEQMAWAADVYNDRYKGKSLPPLKQYKTLKKISKVIQELVKNVFKIVTYPIAVIAMEISIIVGIFFPKMGREGLGWVEHQWSRSWIPPSSQETFFKILPINYTDYLFICMQKKTVWDKRNLYELTYEDYCGKTIRSRLLRCRDLIERYRPILAKIGVDLAKLQKELDRINPSKYSKSDNSELNKDGTYAPTIVQDIVADTLWELSSHVMDARETLIKIATGSQKKYLLITKLFATIADINAFSFSRIEAEIKNKNAIRRLA